MVDPVVGERLRQRLGDVLLADQVSKPLGAVTAIQGLRHVPHPNPRALTTQVTWRPPDARRDPPRTRQSPPTLAAFRPWGSSKR